LKTVKISLLKRILIFILGFTMAIFLLVYAVDWTETGFEFTFINMNITIYVVAGIMVFLGIIASTFIKSGVLGKWKID
jgi:cytochrome c biogenesis protein CcdA